MNVNRVGESKFGGSLCQMGNDLAWSDTEVVNRVVEVRDVAATLLPFLDAAWVHDFHSIPFGGAQ